MRIAGIITQSHPWHQSREYICWHWKRSRNDDSWHGTALPQATATWLGSGFRPNVAYLSHIRRSRNSIIAVGIASHRSLGLGIVIVSSPLNASQVILGGNQNVSLQNHFSKLSNIVACVSRLLRYLPTRLSSTLRYCEIWTRTRLPVLFTETAIDEVRGMLLIEK